MKNKWGKAPLDDDMYVENSDDEDESEEEEQTGVLKMEDFTFEKEDKELADRISNYGTNMSTTTKTTTDTNVKVNTEVE